MYTSKRTINYVYPVKFSFFAMIQVIFLASFFTPYAVAIDFNKIKTVKLSTCSIWSIPVFDGDDIVVSCEGDGKLYAMKFDLNLNLTKSPKRIAQSSDFVSQDDISDHKHIFQNDYHYIVFSSKGEGSGGELVLLKLDKSFNRVKKVSVVHDQAPTNDMFLVGDGTYIYVGKYSPQNGGHLVYKFNEGLEQIGNPIPIGGFDQRYGDMNHANGAVAIYNQGTFYLIAPETLAPGDNDYFFLLRFDGDWSPMMPKQTIFEDPSNLGIVSALVKDPTTSYYIINFTRRDSGEREVIGPIYAATFDSSWDLVTTQKILAGKYQRPHSVLVNDTLYVGYDEEDSGYKAYISKLSIDYDESDLAASEPSQDTDSPQPQESHTTPSEGQESGSYSFNPDDIIPKIELKDISSVEGPDYNDSQVPSSPGDMQILGSTTPYISLSVSDQIATSTVADWWIVVLAPDGFLTLDISNWMWKFIGQDLSELTPVVQYNLFSFNEVPLPTFHFISNGTYYFFFGLDRADQSLNADIQYDLVIKEVE